MRDRRVSPFPKCSLLLFMAVAALMLSGCAGGGGGSSAPPDPPAPTLVSVSVSPANPSLPEGATQQFTATGTYSDNSTQILTSRVTWASSNPAATTITPTGMAKGMGTGTSQITAALSGVTSPADTLTVTPAALVSIAVTPGNPSIAKGLSQQFKATGTYTDNSTQDITASVTWTSGTSTVATITSAGLATGAGTGTSQITAALSGVTSAADALTVTPAALVSIAVTPVNPSIAKGLSQQFKATGTYTDNSTQDLTTSVAWTSGTSTVATITSNGVATGAGTGTSQITAALSGVTSAADTLTVTPAALVSIAVTPGNPSIAKGLSQQFKATGTYTDNSTQDLTTQATWTSGTSTVATITSDGLATGAGTGTSQITAALSGVTSPADTLTVTPAALVSIAVTPGNPSIAKGLSQQFKATGTYTDNSTQDLTTQVTWTSGTSTVATITSAGLATGAGTGTSQITAALSGVTSPADTLTVTPAALVSIAVTPGNPSIAKGLSQQFKATGTYTDNSTQDLTTQATWTSGTSTVATITSAGLATGAGTGTSQITVALSGVTSPVDTLTVTPAALVSIAVTPGNPSIAKGLSQQFKATGTYTDNSTQDITTSVTWTSGTSTVATITSAGLATGAGTGTSQITAALSGVTSAADALTVTPAALVSIAVTPVNPSIAKGLSQQFKATGTYTDNSTQDLTTSVAWTSGTSTVATITSNGVATGAGTGTSQITAALSGVTSAADTLTVTPAALVSIAVTPGNPSIAKGLSQQFKATGTYTDNSTQDLTAQVTWTSGTSAVATITSAGLATGAGTGTSQITAALSGVTSAPDTLTVTPAALVSIAVTPGNPSIAKGLSQQFKATGTYTDNSTQDLTTQATWTSGTSTVATIASDGLATGAGTGTSQITAALSGVTSPADTLTVTPAALVSIAVTPGNPSIAKGLSQQFKATGTYTDNSTQDITASVTWTSGTSTVATITSDGLATGAGTGTSQITVALSGVTSPADTLTVTPAALVSIAVTPGNPSIAKGLSQQFKATGTYTDNSTQDLTTQATWTSGTSTVATITSAGQATGAGTGTSQITAALNGVTSPPDTLTVTPAALVSIAVTPGNPSIAKGLSQQFKATGTYTDNSTQDITASVTWTSGTSTVATITSAGLASSVATGTSQITAALSGVTSAADTLTVTPAALVSIAVTPGNPSIAKGLSQQFKATGTYTDNSTQDITTSVTWTSGTSTVATITSNGVATGAGTGTSQITAALSGVTSAADALTVTPAALVSIAVTPGNASIAKGLSQQFKATGTYTDNSTQDITTSVTWTSGTSTVATIASAGLATGAGTGTSQITAALSGVTSAADTLTVTPAALVSIAVTPGNPSIAKGLSQQFKATGTYTDNSTQDLTTQATWTSGTSTIATITSAGLASSIATGTSQITAALSGVTSPADALTVTPAALVSIAVTPGNPSIAKGLSQQFKATGTYTDNSTQDLTASVTWTSGTSTVATITSNGVATGAGTGTSQITAALSGVTSAADTLTVTPAALVSIAVTPGNPSIAKGLSQQFKATGTYTDNSTQDITTSVTWTSGTSTVATITSEGLASSIATGTSQITAALSGVTSAADTLTVTPAALVSIAVTPGNPSIAKGLSQQFKATGTYTDNSTQDLTTQATWTSGTSTVATITSAGLASSVATGTSQITVALSGVTSPADTLTVTPAALVSIAVTPSPATVMLGNTMQLTATGTYTDNSQQNISGLVTWTSSDSTTATISASGLSTGVKLGGPVTITAAFGSVSGTTGLTVQSLPAITSQPANASVNEGQSATFMVAATGTQPFTYQWQKNASNVSGATSSSYTTGQTTAGDNGAVFDVIITNPVGSTTSSTATLTVIIPPAIATQPASQTVNVGQTATFTVAASGTAPLTYQWQENGTNISGATSAAYTTLATTAADNGDTFDVIVANAAGVQTSVIVSLSVSDSPLITTQPQGESVTIGQTATFMVAVTGATPLSYQWQENAANILGATASSYQTAATTMGDNGSLFTVIVTNSAGSVTSVPASLTVNPAQTTDVATFHNDPARTGQDLTETILTPGNVSSATFAKLGFLAVDGVVDAQPLYLSNVTMPSLGTHNVLYVSTENDSVYAFDATTGQNLWQVSALGSGEFPSDDRSCSQVAPESGITSTPVIDRTRGPHGVIYLVAMSKDSGGHYFQRVHALDLTTGAEMFGGPTTIQASYPGTGDNSDGHSVIFDPSQYKERAALLLENGVVYTTWASHCDVRPYTGWVIGFDANSLAMTQVLNVTPNGSQGGVWMSGAGPAGDSADNVFLLDGNGTFDATLNANSFPNMGDFGNGFLKLSTTSGLAVADYFETFNQNYENSNDLDLGSGGVIVLPDFADTLGTVWHLAVGAGKDTNLYVVNRDSMGKFNSTSNQIYQEIDGALRGGIWSAPAYFNNTLYYGPVGGSILAFGISNAKISIIPASQSATTFAYPGATPSISASGTSNAILWAVENNNTAAVLHAYDATNLATEFYNSTQAAGSRDAFGPGNKFITPTIANGRVYVGTQNGVAMFGLLPSGPPNSLPSITVQPLRQTVAAGQEATFIIAATGTEPLSFQWRMNGSYIPGATLPSYTTPPVTAQEGGSNFDVIVRNPVGSTTSIGAILTVVSVPEITSSPANQTVMAGEQASFSVSTANKTPLAYRWLKNGVEIPGANSSVYTTPPTVLTDNGTQFNVIVSDAQGNVASAAAVLTVVPHLSPMTYYVDHDSGFDGNSGISKTSAWQHAPGMYPCSLNCALIPLSAGDSVIFKGGEIWDHYSFPLTVTVSGTNANPIYYGVDTSWFSGSQWTRPVFDLSGTVWTSAPILLDSIQNAVFDNFEIGNERVDSLNKWPPRGGITVEASANVTIQNCYIHGWSIQDPTNVSDDNPFGGIVFFDGSQGGTVRNCTLDGSPFNDSGKGIWGGTYIHNNTVENVPVGISTADPAADVSGNQIFDVTYSADPTVASNAVVIVGGGNIYNNIIHDLVPSASALSLQASAAGSGNTQSAYNNLIWNPGSGPAVVIVPGSNSGTPSVQSILDNTIAGGASACIGVEPGLSSSASLTIQNNQCISDETNAPAWCWNAANGDANCGSVGSLTFQNNVLMSSSVATSQGYTIADSFQPTSSGNGTVGSRSEFEHELRHVRHPAMQRPPRIDTAERIGRLGRWRLPILTWRCEYCAGHYLSAREPIGDRRPDNNVFCRCHGLGDAWVSVAAEWREHSWSDFPELHDSAGRHDRQRIVLRCGRLECFWCCDQRPGDPNGYNRNRTTDGGCLKSGVPDRSSGKQQHHQRHTHELGHIPGDDFECDSIRYSLWRLRRGWRTFPRPRSDGDSKCGLHSRGWRSSDRQRHRFQQCGQPTHCHSALRERSAAFASRRDIVVDSQHLAGGGI